MLEEKMRYIAGQLLEPSVAQNWLLRLLEFLELQLATFPKKFPQYRESKYRIVVYRNDVIIYEVDEGNATVYIDLACTKGRNIDHLLKLHFDVDDSFEYE